MGTFENLTCSETEKEDMMGQQNEWNNKSQSEPNARGNDTSKQNSGDEKENIREGAHEEAQLDKLHKNVPEGGREAYPEKQAGSPPVSHVDQGNNDEED